MKKYIPLLCVLLLCSCTISDDQEIVMQQRVEYTPEVTTKLETSNEAAIAILHNYDRGFDTFEKKVIAAGIPIYATTSVPREYLLHVADTLLSELKTADGTSYQFELVKKLQDARSYICIFSEKSEIIEWSPPPELNGQILSIQEIVPGSDNSDKTIERVGELLKGS